jgi:hypothetical protein
MAFISAALIGTAATTATATTAATAATAGLIGAGGAVTLGGVASSLFTLVGFGVSLAGASAQANAQSQQFAIREAQLRNQAIVAGQNIKAERESEEQRRRLIGTEGSQREGQIRVAQAALGQLVDVGSAADITEELAGEVAFKKLISQRESNLRVRNLEIEKGNIAADIGINSASASAARTASRIDAVGSTLTAGSRLTRRFRFGDSPIFGE